MCFALSVPIATHIHFDVKIPCLLTNRSAQLTKFKSTPDIHYTYKVAEVESKNVNNFSVLSSDLFSCYFVIYIYYLRKFWCEFIYITLQKNILMRFASITIKIFEKQPPMTCHGSTYHNDKVTTRYLFVRACISCLAATVRYA